MLSKKPLNVGVEHLTVPLPMEFQHPLDGHVTVACRPETIRVIVENRLEDRAQEQPEHFLSDAVPDSGDAEWTSFPVPLGDTDATQG